MLRSTAIIILTLSIFVGRVCLKEQKEGQNSTSIVVSADAKNASGVLIKNNTSTAESPVKLENNAIVTVQPNVTRNDTSPGHLSNGNETAPATNAEKKIGKEKHKCDSPKEAEDMVSCYVTPHDNDDVIEQGTSLSPTESTTLPTVASNSSLENTTKPSLNDSIQNTTQKSVETVVVPLNRTTIDNVSSTTDHPMNTSTTDTDTKLDTNHTTTVNSEASVNSVAPLLGDNVRNKETEDVNGEAKSTDTNNSNSMSTGLIALVTMISFAVVIIVAYIGMIVWRRYVEYRYGHRQLLVNELEFDTNDLRHFEL